MRHGSLFSGIGGFDLAAEWMGWENVFHCEWMEFPRKVLDYHFPDADSHIDICKTDFKKYANKIDILTEDSLANPSALPEKEKAQMMNATCGAKCYEQFKRLNPNSSSQKMSLVSLILMADWYSSRCALTWKLKGTKFSRLLFQLQPKTHHTIGYDAGSLLPTPTVMDQTNATAIMKSTQVKENSKRSITLQRALSMGMLPTPMASDCGGKVTGLENQQSMVKIVRQITGQTSQLNPQFVAEMMGFPSNWTELPFLNGEQNP